MADSSECECQIARVMLRIERNCEAIGRLLNEPEFSARAINRRIYAFALRDEQLAMLLGPLEAHALSFKVFRRAIGQEC